MTISQSRTAATRWSAPKIMLPMRESPQQSAGRSVGGRHGRLEDLEGAVDRGVGHVAAGEGAVLAVEVELLGRA